MDAANRRLSNLEKAILSIAMRNRAARGRPIRTGELDVRFEEIMQTYFGITFRSGFVKAGGTYIEQSLPPGATASDRYVRAEVAIWWAMCRLEDRGLATSYWSGLGTSVWCEGADLTDQGIETAQALPKNLPTKRRWGDIVNRACRRGSREEMNELEKTILRMAFANRETRDSRSDDDVDLTEWEVLDRHFGFSVQSQSSSPEDACGKGPGTSASSEGPEYRAARRAIYEVCISLDDLGLVRMGGPGAPRMAEWGSAIRGWGWNQHQETEVLGGLFPQGLWDTVTLTPSGIERARQLAEEDRSS